VIKFREKKIPKNKSLITYGIKEGELK
jgi:hypothetical protein